MPYYLQAFQPNEHDPLSALVTKKEDLLGNSYFVLKKSKEKVASYTDVSKIICGDDYLFQTLTPHEINMHSLGEQLTSFAAPPFPALSLAEQTALTEERIVDHELKFQIHPTQLHQNVSRTPTAFRMYRRHGDDIILANERTHFVGDVMLLGTFIEMGKAFNRFGTKTVFDLDFVVELSQARRAIEAEAGVTSVFHEHYRPLVFTMPYFDGHDWSNPSPVLLQPGDVVWNTNAEAIYLLNEFTVSNPKIDNKSAVPNRTFIKTIKNRCSATTLIGYGRNMHNILHCGMRSILFGP